MSAFAGDDAQQRPSFEQLGQLSNFGALIEEAGGVAASANDLKGQFGADKFRQLEEFGRLVRRTGVAATNKFREPSRSRSPVRQQLVLEDAPGSGLRQPLYLKDAPGPGSRIIIIIKHESGYTRTLERYAKDESDSDASGSERYK